MDVVEEERKRFEEKYGVAPKGKILIGFKSGKAVWGDEEDEDEDVIVDNSNIRPPVVKTVSTPKSDNNLGKRKELASILNQFAREEIRTDPESIVKAGEEIGVSRDQIRNLYKQYRNEFLNNPPDDYPNKGALAQADEVSRRDREWNANFNRPTPMQASRRSIESPEGEARRLLTKAYKMGISPDLLVKSEGGVGAAVAALKEAGIGRGILTAEETKARKELGVSQRKEQRALIKQAFEELKKQNKLDEENEDEDED